MADIKQVKTPSGNIYQVDIGDPFEYLENKYPDGGAGLHNSIFRGKNLGSAPTADDYENIKNGSFKGIWLGDYWSNDGIAYRNAGADYFYNVGDSSYNTHNICVITDQNLLKSDGSSTKYMMDTDTVPSNGYIGTKMWTDTIPNYVVPAFKKIFGDHLLSHRELLCTSANTSSGTATNWAWITVTANIPNQPMMFGHVPWMQKVYADGFQTGGRNSILPLFAIRPDLISNRENFWLSDFTCSSEFALVSSVGRSNDRAASYAWSGVRPYTVID